MAVDTPLHRTPTSPDARLELLQSLWIFNPDEKIASNKSNFDAFFTYYTKQCRHALHDGGRHISVRHHSDLAELAEDIEEGLSRGAIISKLRSTLDGSKVANELELLNSSVDLTARLISMMDIGWLQYGFSGRPQLVWENGSFKDFVHRYFDQPIVLGHENIKLEKMFTARNLGRIAGIQIVWTDNLADHLRIVDDQEKKVKIFHHASFMKCQQSSIFPEGLISETLRTLALLFPQSDAPTAIYLRTLPDYPSIDHLLLSCGNLRTDDRQIETFKYWHDRLVMLKQVFDESRPSTLSAWWHDRRNGVQWYTFWVAVLVLFLTVFFGMVQSVEGALQVYKAYHPTTGQDI